MPTVREILECPDCTKYRLDQPNLVGACASVGIEHGKTTQRVLLEYLATYHLRGHVGWRD